MPAGVAWRRRAIALLAMALAGCAPAGDRPIQGYIEGEYVRVAAPFAGAQAITGSRQRARPRIAAGCPGSAMRLPVSTS